MRIPKEGSGKHAARKAILTKYPFKFPIKNSNATYDVVFIDALQLLHNAIFSISYKKENEGDESIKTFGELVIYFKNQVEKWYKYQGTTIVIVSFDKHDYVPITKGQTQKSRSSKKMDSDKLKKIEYIKLNTEMPENFNDYISDREHHRKLIIQFLSKQLLNGNHSVKVNDKQMLIIDGHLLTEEIIRNMDTFCGEIPDKSEIQSTPICRMYNDSFVTLFDDRFKNTIGEADFSAFFYHRKLMELHNDKTTYLIVSTDTDILLLGLCYYDRTRILKGEENAKFTIHNGFTKPNINLEVLKIESIYYSMLAELTGMITEKKKIDKTSAFVGNGLSGFVVPIAKSDAYVSSYVTALLCAGCDFIETHAGITHDRIADILSDKKKWALFCKLVVLETRIDGDVGFRLDGEKYVNLLAEIYKDKLKPQLEKVAELEEINFQNLNQMIIDSGSSMHESKAFPSKLDNILSALQVQYYLNLVACLGLSEVSVPEGDYLYKMGYGKIDSSAKWDKNNCVRLVHGSYEKVEDEANEETEETNGEKTKKRKKINEKFKPCEMNMIEINKCLKAIGLHN